MNDENYEELKEQLEEYRMEKERIRNLVGQIGGKNGIRYHKVINQVLILIIFIVIILGLIFKNFSYGNIIQISILLSAIKLIWMISEQQKINHFQFWVLSTLEFRINELDKKISKNLINRGN